MSNIHVNSNTTTNTDNFNISPPTSNMTSSANKITTTTNNSASSNNNSDSSNNNSDNSDSSNNNDNNEKPKVIIFDGSSRADIPTPKLLNYYPTSTLPYGITRAEVSRYYSPVNGVCLQDFRSLSLPGSHIAEGVVLVNLTDIIPKAIIDALLADYTIGRHRSGYSNIVGPFIAKFGESYGGLLTRLFSLRIQNYVVVMHLDVSSTVNYLFRRNTKFYTGLTTTDINDIVINKVNGFLTELINTVAFRFTEYESNIDKHGMTSEELEKVISNIPINNVSVFNYIISTQHDNYHLAGGTASLSMILDNIKSHNKYTSPMFTNNIYYVGSRNSPDVQNLASGINTNLLFMLSNHSVTKKHYALLEFNANPLKFMSIEYIMQNCNTYITPDNLLSVSKADDPLLTIPYYNTFQHVINNGVTTIIDKLERSRSEIVQSYTSMLRPPIDDPNMDKNLLIGINLDIEFDKYILDELFRILNINFDLYNTEPPSILPKTTAFPTFTFTKLDGGPANKLAKIDNTCCDGDNYESNLSKLVKGIMISRTINKEKDKGSTPDDDNDRKNSTTYGDMFTGGFNLDNMDNTKDPFLDRFITMTTSMIDNNPKSTGDLHAGITVKDNHYFPGAYNTLKKEGINYLHVPYNVDTDQLDTVDFIHKLNFTKVLSGARPRRRVNLMRGSALTYDLFTKIANHVIDSNKYPTNIQARFFNFNINTRLRLALGYHAYKYHLSRTLSEINMPSVQSSYLYYRFQKWVSWVKSIDCSITSSTNNPSTATNTTAHTNTDCSIDMECCQCCKCVAKRDIQYYSIGHLPLLSTELIKEIQLNTNPAFWVPRF